MNLRTAMFDMDGVLFDSMRNHAKCWHLTMEHFGFTFPESEAYMHEGRTGAGTINIVSMRERGYPATEEECQAMYLYKSQLFDKCPEAEPMPGAFELLKKVKVSGVTPMVVTGSGQKILLLRLQKSFPGIFRQELMVTAYDVKGCRKDGGSSTGWMAVCLSISRSSLRTRPSECRPEWRQGSSPLP